MRKALFENENLNNSKNKSKKRNIINLDKNTTRRAHINLQIKTSILNEKKT